MGDPGPHTLSRPILTRPNQSSQNPDLHAVDPLSSSLGRRICSVVAPESVFAKYKLYFRCPGLYLAAAPRPWPRPQPQGAGNSGPTAWLRPVSPSPAQPSPAPAPAPAHSEGWPKTYRNCRVFNRLAVVAFEGVHRVSDCSSRTKMDPGRSHLQSK